MVTVNISKKIYELLYNFKNENSLCILLSQIRETEDLVNFLHRYITFNGDFAGGIANLAGAFHIRQDLFRDSEEKVYACSSRSSEIASYIFFGAEDEYVDKKTEDRITHRRLSQIFLKNILEYYSIGSQEFNHTYFLTPEIIEVLEKIKIGYGFNKSNLEKDIFINLGFYIGSELLADRENDILDNYFKVNHPKLVNYLKNIIIDSYGRNAYHYISTHNIIEKEHFDHAIIAAQKAIKFYNGQYSQQELEKMILNGFIDFSNLQQNFFEKILD